MTSEFHCEISIARNKDAKCVSRNLTSAFAVSVFYWKVESALTNLGVQIDRLYYRNAGSAVFNDISFSRNGRPAVFGRVAFLGHGGHPSFFD